MAGESVTRRADGMIAHLASRQHGVVARWQLLRAGLTRDQVDWRLAAGRLFALHRGVYLAGHRSPPRLALEMAAFLAFRGAAAVTHRSSLAMWGLIPHAVAGPVSVTLPPGRSSARREITIHRARLEPVDVRRRAGLVVSSPPRAILEVASGLNARELEHLIADAQYRGLVTEGKLRDQLTRNPRRRGTGELRRILELPGAPSRTRSSGEDALLGLLRRQNLEGFEVNARIHGYEVDFLWRAEGLAVELDGWDGHKSRQAFERDRLKAATLEAQGVSVMPVTGRQLARHPTQVLTRIEAAVARRRARARD